MSSPPPGKKPPSNENGRPDKIPPVEAESRQAGTANSRIAAALDYARLSNSAAAKALGVSATTVSRLRSGTNAREDPESYYRAVARVTGVPLWFLEHGFDGYRVADEEPTVAERVERLERERGALADELRELRSIAERLDVVEGDLSAVLRLAASWPTAAPPGVQPHEQPASRSTEPTPRRSKRRPAEGPPQGDEQ